MPFDFTIRLYQGERTCLADLSDITISNITIINKNFKHQRPYIVKSNQKKFGYNVKVKRAFLDAGGSNQYPCLSFKGEYIDIEVSGFPRYPAFTQEYAAAKACLQGFRYTNFSNKGYPVWLDYRKIEFLNLKRY